jgi:hypothetical protein
MTMVGDATAMEEAAFTAIAARSSMISPQP